MKILASDFDGTIYFQGNIKDSDTKAIQNFQSNGHLFGLSTGRSLKGAIEGSQGKINYDFMLLVSGAFIVDQNYHTIYKKTIDMNLLKTIIADIKDQTISIVVHGNDTVYSYFGIHYDDHLDSLEDFKGDLYGISLRIESVEKAHQVVDYLNENYKEISAYQNIEYIDIVSHGVSKGTAVNFIKDYFKSELIAGIGDSFNDIAMLEKVDVPFTFHNSPEVVKDKAKYLVNSVKEAIQTIQELS